MLEQHDAELLRIAGDRLLASEWFDYTDLRELMERSGAALDSETLERLRVLHCVRYAAMSDDLQRDVRRIVEMLKLARTLDGPAPRVRLIDGCVPEVVR